MPRPWRSGSTATGPRCECGRVGSCFAHADIKRASRGAARPAIRNDGASRRRSQGRGLAVARFSRGCDTDETLAIPRSDGRSPFQPQQLGEAAMQDSHPPLWIFADSRDL